MSRRDFEKARRHQPADWHAAWRKKPVTGRQRAYLIKLGCPRDVIPLSRGEAFDLIASLQRVEKRKRRGRSS